MPRMGQPSSARGSRLAPQRMPSAIAQNKNTKSIGSFTAVRKRTIDSAPTIPKDSTTLLVTPLITNVVTNKIATKETLKLRLYSTPL